MSLWLGLFRFQRQFDDDLRKRPALKHSYNIDGGFHNLFYDQGFYGYYRYEPSMQPVLSAQEPNLQNPTVIVKIEENIGE